jgi:hypothetical protein
MLPPNLTPPKYYTLGKHWVDKCLPVLQTLNDIPQVCRTSETNWKTKSFPCSLLSNETIFS